MDVPSVEISQPPVIAEERLIGTMITRRPSRQAFLVATSATFIITLTTVFYWKDSMHLSQYFAAIHEKIFSEGQTWRIFSAIFAHADLAHLLSNLYMLWIFSYFVFGYFGFGVFPAMSLILSGVVNALASYSYPPDVELIGASGWVYLLGGFWLTMYFVIQRQYKVGNRIMRVLGIGFMIFLPSTFSPTTSYRTHAIGFVFGIAMALAYFAKYKSKIRAYEVRKISLV